LTTPQLAPDIERSTVAVYLDLTGQGPVSRERFWVPFTRSVTNLPPADAPLSLLSTALYRIFSGRRFNNALGLARYPLGDVLFPRVARWLETRGGHLFLNRPARGFERPEGSFLLRDNTGQRHEADVLLWAVPPYFLASYIGDRPAHPTEEDGPVDPKDPAALGKMPIISVNAILDRSVINGAFVGLSGARFDWAFNRNENWGWRSPAGEGQYLSLVASAADDLVAKGDGELLSLAVGELRERLGSGPSSFKLRHSKVVREIAATPRLTLDVLKLRPSFVTPVPGMFLAGDWTDTGLPATVEGAVLSGHRAAAAALSHLTNS